MEHIGEILRRQAQGSGTNRDTDTWSGAEPEDGSIETDCPVCRGAGFVHPRLVSGKPDYSRIIPCECTQQKTDQERLARLQRYSNLGSLTGLTFDNFVTEGRNENQMAREQFRRAYHSAREYAAKPRGWLVLAGPSGCGKTHLAAAIANYCIGNNQPAFYISTPDLLDHLRSTFSPSSEMAYDEFFEQVRNTPLLILDDLGAQSSTPWAKEKLDQLLNHRFNNRLPTVIVSIIPIDELDERIRSRLVSWGFCQVCTVDDRPMVLSNYAWAPEFKREKEMTFDNFDSKRVNLPLEQRQNLATAFQLAVEFAKSPSGWLIFQGETGCGKTHLAAAIVNYRYQINQPAMFIVAPDFLDHLRSSFSPESKVSYDQIFESVKKVPLLVLDDFGKQTTTPWAQEKMYQVINSRYNAEIPTVITTNCSIDEIDRPIASRFVNPKLSVFFNISAPDYWAGWSNDKVAPRAVKRGRSR